MEKEMSKNISNNNETPKDMYPEKLGRICQIQKNSFLILFEGKELPAKLKGSFYAQEAELLQGGYLKGLPREAGSLGSKCWTGKEMDMQQMC